MKLKLMIIGLLTTAVILLINVMYDMSRQSAQERVALASGRTVTVDQIGKFGNLSVVTFFGTDSVLIIDHHPDGWYTDDKAVIAMTYAFVPGKGSPLTSLTVRSNNGHDERHTEYNNLVHRQELIRVLWPLHELK